MAEKKQGELFERPTQQSAGFGSFVLFVVTMALLFGGMYLTAISFGEQGNVVTFFAGIILATVSFFISFGTTSVRK